MANQPLKSSQHYSVDLNIFIHPKNPGVFKMTLQIVASKRLKDNTTPIDPDTDVPSVIFATAAVTQKKAVHERIYYACM